MAEYFTIRWLEGGVVRMIDQRRIPHEIVYLDYTDPTLLAQAIRDMVIRGAPALGAAGSYGLALAAVHSQARNTGDLLKELQATAEILRSARPTAVNLSWGIDRTLNRAMDPELKSVATIQEAVLEEALAIAEEDAQTNRQIGMNGQALIPERANIIHHCNTGTLATVDYGTALGVIRAAHEAGKQIHVYVDETRPRLQGARLTAWELQQLGIPHTVIADGASGHFMRIGKVDLCLVGCDRIAADGDTANKVGTYNLALAAYAHQIPFYVVGPTSTVDLSIPSGDFIHIEERPEQEVTHINDIQITPVGTKAANPAFDITPAKYIAAIITEKGVIRPPYEENLRKAIGRK